MKKLLLLIALVMGIGAVNAQLGIQAGATFYSGKATVDNLSVKYDTKVGFTAGLVYSASLSDNFSFMPSLNFTQKGGKVKFETDDDKVTLNYIDLPLNFVYNTSPGGTGFFVGAGPDLAFGISGKEKSGGESSDIHFGSSADDDFKAFEFSLNVLAGYRMENGFFVAANYNPGISNISPEDGTKFHNNGFAIRVGCFFGGKVKKTSDTQ